MSSAPRRPSGRLAAVLLLIAGAACGGEPEARATNDVPAALAGAEPLSAVVTAADSARRYRSPPSFPLAFHTVLPEGFRASEEMGGPGATVQFTWSPGGEQRDSAFVFVRAMDAGTEESRAREIVRTTAERLRIPGDRSELEPRNEIPWAVVEYPIRSVGTFQEPVKGWVALGWREGRWFYVIAQSSVGAWPVFQPHAETILSQWRWADAGGAPGPAGLTAPG